MKVTEYGGGQKHTATDEQQVRGLYLRAMEGWNAGSGHAFAAPFAEESGL